MSTAKTAAAGNSLASVSAMAPEPVPTSATRGDSTTAGASTTRGLDHGVPVPFRDRLRRNRRAGQPLARHFDQRLGVGAGDQHAGVDGELQPPELFLADEVGDRLAGLAPLDERADGGELLGQQRPIELHVELQARQPERVRHQQLGVEARRRQVSLGEPGDRPADDLENGPARRGRRRFGGQAKPVTSSAGVRPARRPGGAAR